MNKCEEELKSKYNINQNETLLIFKYDYIQKDLLVPIVGYEVFHPKTKENLDLNYCKQKINIIVPAEIKENELYKHNPNSFYYKDKCNSYPNGNGVDMTIYNRKSEYNKKIWHYVDIIAILKNILMKQKRLNAYVSRNLILL